MNGNGIEQTNIMNDVKYGISYNIGNNIMNDIKNNKQIKEQH